MGASEEGTGLTQPAPSTEAAANAAGGLPAADPGDAPAAHGRKRRRELPADVHVRWDEENIAEHDKERGTRQKIDEPPTPWARSPLSASEDSACPSPGSATPTHGSAAGGEVPCKAVDPAEVAAVLNELVAERMAAGAASLQPEEEEGNEAPPAAAAPPPAAAAVAATGGPAAAAAEGERPAEAPTAAAAPPPAAAAVAAGGGPAAAAAEGERRAEAVQHRWGGEPPHGVPPPGTPSDRRPVFAGIGAGEDKPSSASFRAKRSQHYNEFKMLQAFRQQQAAKGKSSDDEDDEK